MKYRLLFFLFLLQSALSFGESFQKRWFWFYDDENERSVLIISFDPEAERYSVIDHSSNDELQNNPFSAMFNGNWYDVFRYSDMLARSDAPEKISFLVPGNDPLLRHVLTEKHETFTLSYVSNIIIRNAFEYKKVVFKNVTNGALILIYLQKTSENSYRVNAVLMKSSSGKKYSYRDLNFKRDFGGGDSGAAGTVVQFITHQRNYHRAEEFNIKQLTHKETISDSMLSIKEKPVFLYLYIIPRV